MLGEAVRRLEYEKSKLQEQGAGYRSKLAQQESDLKSGAAKLDTVQSETGVLVHDHEVIQATYGSFPSAAVSPLVAGGLRYMARRGCRQTGPIELFHKMVCMPSDASHAYIPFREGPRCVWIRLYSFSQYMVPVHAFLYSLPSLTFRDSNFVNANNRRITKPRFRSAAYPPVYLRHLYLRHISQLPS